MSQKNIFHEHLDVCFQCRTQPLNLCPEGYDALFGQSNEAAKNIQRMLSNPVYDGLRAAFRDDAAALRSSMDEAK